MTTTTPPLTGEPAEDRFGHTYFRVPLSGRDGAGRFALIDGSGMRKLREAGARSLYLISDNQGRQYVGFLQLPSRRPTTAARAILGDPKGRRVEYLSGDRLDCRRSNLHVRQYAGVGDCRAVTATEPAA